VEPLSIDEAFLDLEGCEGVLGMPAAAALVVFARRVEREIGVTVSVGLSYCKFLAKLASDLDKPRGFAMIGRAEARARLASLGIGRLWGVVSVHTPGIDPTRTEEVREPSRLLGLLCWRGFAPINWCWGPVWERVRHGSWRGRLRGGNRKPSNLVGCKWRLSSRSARASAGQFRYANLGLCAGR